jgi:membrane protease subunit HflC
MSPKSTISIIGLALVAVVVYFSAFVVYQWELAIKLQLGEIVDADYEPGLHWKYPLVNNVIKFDKRIQTLDARPERFLTIEKKFVVVDSYAKWRISNVAQYFRSTGGDPLKTSRLLSERINTALRDEFGKRTIQEAISGERAEIMELLRRNADEQASELGVEIIDVRVKRIDFPREVSDSVYGRMSSERERVAAELRAQGEEKAEEIQADADRQKTVIVAEAYKQAEQMRGEGDARAAEIYANAFNRNREFYAFYRSLNAYRAIFEQGGDIMVLEPDSEFFEYFKNKGK